MPPVASLIQSKEPHHESNLAEMKIVRVAEGRPPRSLSCFPLVLRVRTVVFHPLPLKGEGVEASRTLQTRKEGGMGWKVCGVESIN